VAQAVPLAHFDALIPDGARRALEGGTWRAEVLPGGRQVNLCLRLLDEATADRAVLRIRRGPELPGADFARELACHGIAARAGLAPAIRAADAQQRFILMDHVDGDRWSAETLRDDSAAWRLGERLRRLHSLEVPPFPPVEDLALLGENCAVLEAHGDGEARELMRRGAALTAQLALLPRRPPVMCHGDPDAANFLGPVPILIDFEYAQVADPVYDLALLLTYYPDLEPLGERLRVAMALDDELSRRRLPLQLELCRIVGQAWQRAQSLLS
jgi:aminoglycoside phosphotransferase